MTSYQKWKSSLKEHQDLSYHSNMLKYSNEILNDIGRSNQKKVAEDLQLKPSHFSILKPLLLAYTELNHAH